MSAMLWLLRALLEMVNARLFTISRVKVQLLTVRHALIAFAARTSTTPRRFLLQLNTWVPLKEAQKK
jgi:hypothetical protein